MTGGNVMWDFITLEDHLGAWSHGNSLRAAAAETIAVLAHTCCAIAGVVASGRLAGDLAAHHAIGVGGEAQKELDVRANELLVTALLGAPVAAVASKEMEAPVPLTLSAPVVVAIDPLDGSSNIDANVSLGTIFSILPTPSGHAGAEPTLFLRQGREQIAAGYVIYGPQTALALTIGQGTDFFTLDSASGGFQRTGVGVRVPRRTHELAINASNYRHWDVPVRTWFDDCLAVADGLRGEDFNMRWIGSMVAEAHRILGRGGIYLYPGDARKGYRTGRLRLIYEANPVAMLMEQAGAAASTGRERILDRLPRTLHERVPLVFGSSAEVERLERYHVEPHPIGERSPLFARRGLFRA
jgi:fructose-1,6-bisphosphatase I